MGMASGIDQREVTGLDQFVEQAGKQHHILVQAPTGRAVGSASSANTAVTAISLISASRRTLTFGPRGAQSAGSDAAENSTTERQPVAAIRCIGPVSLPTAA